MNTKRLDEWRKDWTHVIQIKKTQKPSPYFFCETCQIWRNCRWGRNSQYLKHDEVEWNFPKLWKLLALYGEAFDDQWYYRKTEQYVIRCPVWDKPRSGSYWENKDER